MSSVNELVERVYKWGQNLPTQTDHMDSESLRELQDLICGTANFITGQRQGTEIDLNQYMDQLISYVQRARLLMKKRGCAEADSPLPKL